MKSLIAIFILIFLLAGGLGAEVVGVDEARKIIKLHYDKSDIVFLDLDGSVTIYKESKNLSGPKMSNGRFNMLMFESKGATRFLGRLSNSNTLGLRVAGNDVLYLKGNDKLIKLPLVDVKKVLEDLSILYADSEP